MNLVALRPPRTTQSGEYSALLVCSAGGHLAQLLRLEPWFATTDRTWVSFGKDDARSLLAEENFVEGHHPTTRNIPNLLRNLRLAWTTLRQVRPDVIVSNGAGMAVPFFWLGWMMRIPTVFVEVYDRIDSSTMTGRLVRPVTSKFCVQWDEQVALYPGAEVIGPLW